MTDNRVKHSTTEVLLISNRTAYKIKYEWPLPVESAEQGNSLRCDQRARGQGGQTYTKATGGIELEACDLYAMISTPVVWPCQPRILPRPRPGLDG